MRWHVGEGASVPVRAVCCFGALLFRSMLSRLRLRLRPPESRRTSRAARRGRGEIERPSSDARHGNPPSPATDVGTQNSALDAPFRLLSHAMTSSRARRYTGRLPVPTFAAGIRFARISLDSVMRSMRRSCEASFRVRMLELSETVAVTSGAGDCAGMISRSCLARRSRPRSSRRACHTTDACRALPMRGFRFRSP